jgi:Ulp1 family protease
MTQVPRQQNTKDCACFMIYFAKKFFNNPEATMALIKVAQSVDYENLN